MKIFVIGIGPGDIGQITPRAREALRQCDVVAGYQVYIDLLGDLAVGKELLSTPMKREVERCEMARDRALAGQTVAMVSSGDAGIYGMAGLMYEVCRDYPKIAIEVIPGITAASAGAAVLGAPLMHDFAVVSLSDLMTPWEKIENRLKSAAEGDFVICLYNPASRKRADYLNRASVILLGKKAPDTPCGIVRNIGREGERAQICTLEELKDIQVDMFTTVIIGNSQTKIINGKLVTPRGYQPGREGLI